MSEKLLKNINPFDFFILLCAFVYGNIFAIQCSTLNWGFLLIFGIVIFIENIEKIFYLFFTKNKQKILRISPYFSTSPFNLGVYGFSTFFLLNTVKRGFLLGIFLEAFKVGS